MCTQGQNVGNSVGHCKVINNNNNNNKQKLEISAKEVCQEIRGHGPDEWYT